MWVNEWETLWVIFSTVIFSQARYEVIVKYTNCNLVDNGWIRTGIRTLVAQIDGKKEHWSSAKSYWFLLKKDSIPKKSIPKIKSSYQKLNVPHRKTNVANVGQKALSYVGPSLWNNLNKTLKTSTNLNTFKHNIKQHFNGLKKKESY